MLTSNRGLAARLTIIATTIVATPAMAQDITDPPGVVEISGNAGVVTDYRFRGVSLSGGDAAIQGGIDVAHESGFYVGTWASSIDDGGSGAFGDMELDIYGGWSGQLAEGVDFDAGLIYYIYPTEDLGLDTDYFEGTASIGTTLGPVTAKLGGAYAWDQNALGDDNLYLYGDLNSGLPGTPITLSAHLGYTDGVLAPPLLAGSGDDTGMDYSIGASYAIMPNLEAGISYVGVDGPSIDSFTNDTLVGTLTFSF